MNRSENFEHKLPDGYKEVFVIDAGDKKTGVIFNVAALAVMAVVFLVTACMFFRGSEFVLSFGVSSLPWMAVFCVSIFAYLVLHELVHGATYYLLTRQKLTFGISWTVAFCGIPGIYVYKKAALIALLAPFITFDAIFLLSAALARSAEAKLMFITLFSLHFGGCVGDLYDTVLLLFRFRGDILVNDTGPKQTFYSDAT